MLRYINPKSMILSLIIVQNLISVTQGQLRVGFYSQSCPTAESIVRSAIKEFVKLNTKNAAILLRLQFHDCFVEGCDASILINKDGNESETQASGNAGVEGFDIIEDVKARLEGVCPGVVSCADIVALAARDALSMVNGPLYEVPTGRRDGRVSMKSLANNIPEVDDSIKLLKSKFSQKGLSDKDLVLLSGGAHTIGFTACFFMQKRLYNFTDAPGGGSDPAIDPHFLPKLKAMCPFGEVESKIPLDPVTKFIFDDKIFRNIKKGFAVIASDARLNDDINTKQILDSYITTGSRKSFKADFAEAMVKMGNIGVKTGQDGEIRRVCGTVN
ncbi:hypothetical protein JRO89_XS07G0209000 [Xanthoceras sorbifolium]|uniref:Peroxidase n=1 Tax=Xanthoceras sorbifolium TaxID=99658 RepID=A0ABQ8HUG0_9ROSI|nr:hypothetical protein JRO89_XS07G0209000 [Xanthoceras sorbifolium]